MKSFDYNNEISMEETLLKTADHTLLSKVALNSFAESTQNDILKASEFNSLELDTLKPIVKAPLTRRTLIVKAKELLEQIFIFLIDKIL